MDEPLGNINLSSDAKPDPELGSKAPKWFIGKYAKIAFPAIRNDKPIKEWMWVNVDCVVDGKCVGILDNDPIFTDKVKCDDEITFSPSEVAEICEID